MFKRVRSGFTGPYLHGVSRADNLQWHLCTGGVDPFFWPEPPYSPQHCGKSDHVQYYGAAVYPLASKPMHRALPSIGSQSTTNRR